MTTEDKTRLIIQVLSDQLNASDAARQMGVSRKTYYKWENRALTALRTSLEVPAGGRPRRQMDPEKQAWLKEKAQLQARVQELEQILRVHAVLQEDEGAPEADVEKKSPGTGLN